MTGERVSADSSAIARLYFKQEGSREMALWRWRTSGGLPVTQHGRAEIVNSIALAVFRRELGAEDGRSAWLDLENDFIKGRLVLVNLLWRAALNRAVELSRVHSPKIGTRSLDVLHVSCALELGLKHFLSFDEGQKALAVVVGLKVIAI